MKKLIFAIVIGICPLALSGCKVNWFGQTYDAPWYFIAIFVAVIFVIAHFSIMSQTYICPHCGAEIKPKWYNFNTYMHWCGKRFVKCPVCRKMGYGKRKKD